MKTHHAINTPLPNAFPADEITLNTADKNGTLICVIIDESGSMQSVQDATIAGFNEFVQGQRAAKDVGQAYLTLIKFDAPHIKTVYKNLHINNVPDLDRSSYQPNGGTNLLDAVGEAIYQVNGVLGEVEQSERPGVLIVIMTDGYENSSMRYTNDKIKTLVAAAEHADWTFMFLGANIDSFAAGSQFGMNAMNTVNYDINDTGGTYSRLATSTTAIRGAKMKGMSTNTIYATGTTTSGFVDRDVEGK